MRERLAAYVGASVRPVLVPNATTAVNAVAARSTSSPGTEVVDDGTGYGDDLLWRYTCERRSATYLEIDTSAARAVGELLGAFTPRTRALFVSHISSTALRFPVEELCARARDAGVLTIVDGAHAPGQIALDVGRSGRLLRRQLPQVAVYAEGAGFLHARREAQPLLEPLASWDWPAGEAERFRWTGTHDPSPHLAVPAAIDFQVAHDWTRCARAAMSWPRAPRAS